MARLKILVFVALFMFFVAAVPVSSAEHAVFYLKPNNVEGDQSWVMLKGAPGMEVKGEFVLVNQSGFPVDYSLLLLDASHTDEVDGYFALKEDTEAQTSIGYWGYLSSDEINLDAGESEVLTVTFTIPSNVELGSYWGGILAMESHPQGSESGMVSVIRNGLRVNLEILSQEDYDVLYGVAEPVAVPAEATPAPAKDYSSYIIAGIAILAAALVIASLKTKK